MQRYELETVLGSDHSLDGQQMKDLIEEAYQIEQQYPDPNDAEIRGAALVAAYRAEIREGLDSLIEEYGQQLAEARKAEQLALAALRQLARYGRPEAEFARTAGIDRMTVRKWLGKR